MGYAMCDLRSEMRDSGYGIRDERKIIFYWLYEYSPIGSFTDKCDFDTV